MKNLQIVFDGRIFVYALGNHSSRTGIFWVAKNLLLKMIALNNLNIFLYLPKEYLVKSDEIFADLKITPLPIMTENSDFSKINSFFSAFDIIPKLIEKYPNISCYTLLHDTISLYFPQYFPPDIISNYMVSLVNSLKYTDYYFTNSNNTAKDFMAISTKINPKNIKTTLLSTNQKYKQNKNSKEIQEIRRKYNIPEGKKYLFSLCSLEPRKNLIRAVKSFVKFIEKNNIDDIVYVLGGQAWGGFIEKFKEEVPEYEKYKDKIIRAGYIDDEDLEILYSNAEWFVYTSQYEGFGMPPLEAMACACPVITSNNSSLPEVVGDAGLMIDYDSEEQHIAAYEKYYFDNNFRQEMAQKGLERSKLFSWDKTVEIILNKMYDVEAKKAQQPLVTIITASYNLIEQDRKDYFIQNLESVKNQTYANIEHIVIDGASTDGTIELLKEYQDKGWIKYYSEPDKGIYDALNKGILKANGKYVVCLNSDDFYCNNQAVELEVLKLEETEADACYANAIRVKPDTLEKISDWNGDGNFEPLTNSFPCHQTFMIKTEVMKELGLYNTKYKVSADNIFLQKLVNEKKQIVGIDKNIVYFRDGGFSNSNFELSAQERKKGYYEEYGQFHNLTPYDINNLYGYHFCNIKMEDAINLGAKLINTNDTEWITRYFSVLIHHHLNQQKQSLLQYLNKEIAKKMTLKEALKIIGINIFSVKNSGDKKHKVIMMCGAKIKLKKLKTNKTAKTLAAVSNSGGG